MYRLLLLSIFIVISFTQTNQEELPIGFTPDEWANRHQIYEMQGRQTDPPNSPIRAIAEFERMQGVLIRYPFGITTSVIAEMSEDVLIYCLCSTGSQSAAYNSMSSGGTNMDNVEFILGATDSYWTRDYGPWWVVDGNNELVIVDHTYNRPRPNDNQAPQRVSDYLGTGYFASDLITAGGNFMTDGFGVGSSSTLTYEENLSLGIDGVDALFQNYYGIAPYYALEDPNNTYIDHIDCWGKFLSPSKVLIRSVPETHAQFDELEATANFYATNVNGYGEEYEVFRVYTPQNQPYTNSLILNNKVLVPVMSSQWDDEAIAVYEEALPGYEIIGVTGSWESTDAIHCRTKGIPDLGMLQIFHNSIDDQDVPAENYEVRVEIIPLSGTGLIDEELYFGWKNSFMDEYEILPLISTGNESEYSGFIPQQPADTEVHYYIHAADESGRIETLPIAGYFQFDAIGGAPSQSGDVNLDGDINVLDIVAIVSHILGMQFLEGYALELADVNSDSLINVLDIIFLINIITGN
ncbi:MAG: agmatine deiminase family protein [Fidelibacterota bacterium]